MMVKNKGDYFRHQLGQDNSTAKEAIELTNLWSQYVNDVAILDPLFWQALGKALGHGINQRDNVTNRLIWQQLALDYFDLVLTGGDTEKFWKELLNT